MYYRGMKKKPQEYQRISPPFGYRENVLGLNTLIRRTNKQSSGADDDGGNDKTNALYAYLLKIIVYNVNGHGDSTAVAYNTTTRYIYYDL